MLRLLVSAIELSNRNILDRNVLICIKCQQAAQRYVVTLSWIKEQGNSKGTRYGQERCEFSVHWTSSFHHVTLHMITDSIKEHSHRSSSYDGMKQRTADVT